MNRLRPYVSALLGLMLLVQGVAASAAGYGSKAVASSADDAAQVMPCHGSPATDSGGGPCCNDECPNMAMCMLGHLAVAAAVHVEVPLPLNDFDARRVLLPVASTPQSLLRPPIALHA